MGVMQALEAASYLVTVIGLPLAIWVFVHDRRRERQNDEEEIFLRLSDEYSDFMRLVIDNADLHLISASPRGELSEEQRERRHALFAILVSLFERAYVLVYEERMSPQQARLWQTWTDYMQEWCAREDFRAALPALLQGEDPAFVATIRQIAVTSPRNGDDLSLATRRTTKALPGKIWPKGCKNRH